MTAFSLKRGWLSRLAAAVLVTIGLALPAHAQNNQQAAQLALQIQQLQEQIRTLTGQVEGLQFQLTQMQTLIEKMQADNEFRFQELEGGAGGKTEAATDSGGVMPTDGLPQDQTAAAAVPADPTLTPDSAALPGLESPVAAAPTAALPSADLDLGQSQDPLVGTGQIGPGQLGPLTLNSTAATAEPDPDAQAQYNAGYDAVTRGDYAFAEEQFRQFVALYPNDPQAADATNWLGEALLQRGAYDEAADVALTGFQNYPNSPRAPDLLMKVGVALAAVGERDAACRTFSEVRGRYQGLSLAFVERLTQEEAKAECPPAG